MGVKDLWNALLSWPQPKTRSTTVTKSRSKVVSNPIIAWDCERCPTLCSPSLSETARTIHVSHVDTVYIDLTLLVSSAASVIHQSSRGNSLITGQLFRDTEMHSILSKSYSSIKNLMQQGVTVVCVCDGQAPDIKVKRHLSEQHSNNKPGQGSFIGACLITSTGNSANRCLQLLCQKTHSDSAAVTTADQRPRSHARLPTPNSCARDSLCSAADASLVQRLQGLTLVDSSSSSSPSSSSSRSSSSSLPSSPSSTGLSSTSANHSRALHSHLHSPLGPLPTASSSSCGLCVTHKKAYTLMDICRILAQCLHAAGMPVVTPVIGEAEMVCSVLARQHDTILHRQQAMQRRPGSIQTGSFGDADRLPLDGLDCAGEDDTRHTPAENCGVSGVYVWSKDADVLPFGAPAFIRPDSKDDYTGTFTSLHAASLRENVGFSQQDWVLFALYCGSDYCHGVSGYGKVKTIKRIYALHEIMKTTCHLAHSYLHRGTSDGGAEQRVYGQDIEEQRAFQSACEVLVNGLDIPTTKNKHSHKYGYVDDEPYASLSFFSWDGIIQLIHKGSVAVLLAYWLWTERKYSSSTNSACVRPDFSPNSSLDSILQSVISELRKVYTLTAFMTIVSEYMYPVIALDQRCESHASSYWPYCVTSVENNVVVTLNKLVRWHAASAVDAALTAFGDSCIAMLSAPYTNGLCAMRATLQDAANSRTAVCGDGSAVGVVVKTPLWDLLLTTALRNYFMHPQHALMLPTHRPTTGVTAIAVSPPQSLASESDKIECLQVRRWLKYAATQGRMLRASICSADALFSSTSSPTSACARDLAQAGTIGGVQYDNTVGFWSFLQSPESQPDAISRVFDIITFATQLGTGVPTSEEKTQMRTCKSSSGNVSPSPITDLKIPFNSTNNVAVSCEDTKNVSMTPPSVSLYDLLCKSPTMLPKDVYSRDSSCIDTKSCGADALLSDEYMYAVPLAIVDVATRKQRVLYSVAFAIGSVIVIIDMWHDVVRQRCRALFENVCMRMHDWEGELVRAKMSKKTQKTTSKKAAKKAEEIIPDPSQRSLSTYLSQPTTEYPSLTPIASTAITPETLRPTRRCVMGSQCDALVYEAYLHVDAHYDNSLWDSEVEKHKHFDYIGDAHSSIIATNFVPYTLTTAPTAHASVPTSSTTRTLTSESPLDGALSLIQRMRQRLARDHTSPPTSDTCTGSTSAMPCSLACTSSRESTPFPARAKVPADTDARADVVPEPALGDQYTTAMEDVKPRNSESGDGIKVNEETKTESVRGKKEMKGEAPTDSMGGRKTRGRKSAFAGKLPPGQKSIREYIRIMPRRNTSISPRRETSTHASVHTRVPPSSPLSTSDSPLLISDSPIRPPPSPLTLIQTRNDASPELTHVSAPVSLSKQHNAILPGQVRKIDAVVAVSVRSTDDASVRATPESPRGCAGNDHSESNPDCNADDIVDNCIDDLSDSFDIELSDGMFSDVSDDLIDVEAMFAEASEFVDDKVDAEGVCARGVTAERVKEDRQVHDRDDEGLEVSVQNAYYTDDRHTTYDHAHRDSDQNNAYDDNIYDHIDNPENNDDNFYDVVVANDYSDVSYIPNASVDGDGDSEEEYVDTADAEPLSADGDYVDDDDDWCFGDEGLVDPESNATSNPITNVPSPDAHRGHADECEVDASWVRVERDFVTTLTFLDKRNSEGRVAGGEGSVCAVGEHKQDMSATDEDGESRACTPISSFDLETVCLPNSMVENPMAHHKGIVSPEYSEIGLKNPLFSHFASPPKISTVDTRSNSSSNAPEIQSFKSNPEGDTYSCLSPTSSLSPVLTVKLRTKTRTNTHIPLSHAATGLCSSASPPSCVDPPGIKDAEPSHLPKTSEANRIREQHDERRLPVALHTTGQDTIPSVPNPTARVSGEGMIELPIAQEESSTLPQTTAKPLLYALYRRNRSKKTPNVVNTTVASNTANNLSNILGIEASVLPSVPNRMDNDISGAQLHTRQKNSNADTSCQLIGDIKSSEIANKDTSQAKPHQPRDEDSNNLPQCTAKRLPGSLYRRGRMRLSPSTT